MRMRRKSVKRIATPEFPRVRQPKFLKKNSIGETMGYRPKNIRTFGEMDDLEVAICRGMRMAVILVIPDKELKITIRRLKTGYREMGKIKNGNRSLKGRNPHSYQENK